MSRFADEIARRTLWGNWA